LRQTFKKEEGIMNPKRFFAVVMALVIAVSFRLVAPAFSQIQELVQTQMVIPDIHFGWSVAGDCDLDGDAIPDLIVGGPTADPFGKPTGGRVWVFSGADGHVICILDGEAAGDRFGYSVSCAGDVNDDDTMDFIVGAPGHSNNTGKAYIYSGQTFSLLHTFTGEATGDKFGFSVCGAGDANADGCDDLIIGAPGADWASMTDCGKIYLYRGCSWTKHWDDHGEASYDSLGYSVSGGCDVNNDGYDDIIVGAPYFDGAFPPNNGRVYVLSGIDRELLCYKYGTQANALFGWSVAGAGDINDDDDCDFIVGSPGYDNYTGAAYVYYYYGPVLQCVLICDLYGGGAGDLFGWSVSGAGDANNDGIADMIIGAPGADSRKGKAYVYLGPSCSAHCIILGRETDERFGFSVSSAGDVGQDDNKDDVIIGAPFRDCNPYCTGRAYVHSGEEGCPEIYDFYPVYPSIHITAPTEGECLQAASQDTVRWDTSYVDWIDSIPNTAAYSWAVPDTCADSCLILMCISNQCPSVCDESNYFSIGRIELISPNGGEIWCVDSFVCVTWTPCCFAESVKIELSTNSGSTWDIILTDGTLNDGEYCFYSPFAPSESCGIRISDASNGDPYDQSDGDFTIYLPGDATGDSVVNIADAIYIVNYLFQGEPPPYPMIAGDANCDGVVNIADVVYLVTYLFSGGPPPRCCAE
jgi:hypothetical protein